MNRAKLDRVQAVWEVVNQSWLPPVLVTHIDGELSLIDGHARTLAVYEGGAVEILGEYEELERIRVVAQ